MSDEKRKIRLNAALCRHAYADGVEALARLASFATSRSLEKIGHGEYFIVAEELCKKDLLLASISTRRLAELTASQLILKDHSIEVRTTSTEISDKGNIHESIWNILGNVIHGVDIDVVKGTGMAKYRLGIELDLLKAVDSREEVDAAIRIKSDKFPGKIFKLVDFCDRLNHALDQINDVMSYNGVFLGSAYESY